MACMPETHVHIHVHDEVLRLLHELTDRVECLERKLKVADSDIKKIRKAIDRIMKDEEKEDADALAYRTEKEAKIAELTAQIAELEKQPKLSDEDKAEMVALREQLETLSPPPPEDQPPADGGPVVVEE